MKKMWKLDFGCGSGGYPGGDAVHPKHRGSWLEKNGDADTIAFDINAGALMSARNRIKSDVAYLIADGTKLPFTTESFDYVREWGVLHHISNYVKALEEIARVTKKGGMFVACETVDNDPFYSACRTVVGNWKGARIESRFKSDEFVEEVSKFFQVQHVEFWHRPLIIDIPSYYVDDFPGMIIGLYWQYYASKILMRLGLLPKFARHVSIRAVRR